MAKEEEEKIKNQELPESKNSITENTESFDELKKSIEKDVKRMILDFKEEDKNKINGIVKSISLDSVIVGKIKEEIGLDGKIENLNKESEELARKTVEELQKIYSSKEQKESKNIDENTLNKVRIIIESEKRINYIEEQKKELDKKASQLYLGEYDLRKKTLDVEILKAKGDINTSKEGLSDDDLNNLRIIVSSESSPKIIKSETEQEKTLNQKKEQIIKNIDLIGQAIVSTGYTYEQLEEMARSDNPEQTKIIEKIEKVFEELRVDDLAEDLLEEKPNELLDIISSVKPDFSFLKEYLYDFCKNKKNINTQKLIDVVFSKMVNKDNVQRIIEDIESRIEKDKQDALKKMPIEDILSSWENETPKERGWDDDHYSWRSNEFCIKIASHIDGLIKSGDYAGILKIKERLDALEEKNSSALPTFHDCYPSWLDKLNINREDSLRLITKQLSWDSFLGYFGRYNNIYVPYNLIPDDLPQEEKDKIINSILLKENLEFSDIEEYLKITGKDIFQVMNENKNILSNILKSNDDKIINLILNSENAPGLIKEGLIKLFDRLEYDAIMNLKEKYNLSDESIALAAEEGFMNTLSSGLTYRALEIKDKFNLSEQRISFLSEKIFKQSILNGDFYSAMKIKKEFDISNEPVESIAEEVMLSFLSNNQIRNTLSFVTDFNISEKVYLPVLEKSILNKISEGNYSYFISVNEYFNIPDEFRDSVELKETIEKEFINQLSNGNLDKSNILRNRFNLSDEFIKSPDVISVVKKLTIASLEKGDSNFLDNLSRYYHFSTELTESPEVISAAKKGAIINLEEGNISGYTHISEIFNIPNEFLKSPEIISAAEKGLISIILYKNDFSYVFQTIEKFNIPDEFLKSPEVISAVEKSLIDRLSYGNISYNLNIKNKFSIPEEFFSSPEVISAVEKGLIYRLSDGQINEVINIKDNFNIPEEFFSSPEVISAAENGFNYKLSIDHIYDAILIKDNFAISEEFIISKTQKAFIHELADNGSIDVIFKIKDNFNIPEEFFASPGVISAAEKGLVDNLSYGHISGAIKIMENFNLSREVIASSAENAIIVKIKNGYINDALDIKNKFNIEEKNIIPTVKEFIKKNLLDGNFYLANNVKEQFNISNDFFNDSFGELINEIKKEENGEVKSKSLKNIKDSFLINQNRDKLPEQIKIVLDRFENQYGNKGKNLIALAVSAYGIENPESFERRMKNIENVLNRYNPDTIPDGVKTSIGIEYEVTTSVGKVYKENSHFGYEGDIKLVSQSSNIGQGGGGPGAIYEFTTKPTYNPYILMAEMKLLQDAGFVDLNFEKYQHASRCYHLSLVGDSGLSVDHDMYFLNNMLSMAQLTGITAGEDVSRTKDIHAKSFEHFSDNDQNGCRCEMKGMSTDSVEQFEKTVITSHNAGIAIQLRDKYLGQNNLNENFDDAEGFEKKLKENGLLLKPFESDQERDIVYEWEKLKASAVESVNQHNESFINNEFNGLSLDKNGELIDITDHIFIIENEKRLIDAKITKKELMDEIRMDSGDLFDTQNPEFMNALSKIVNFFLFKKIHPDSGQYITIEQPDGTQKKIINLSNIIPIFNMRDEGYKVRDKDNGGSEDRKKSIFDYGNEIRDGYYNIGNASEEMVIHKAQILINRFNKKMEELLRTKGEKRKVEQDSLVNV